MKKRLHGCNIEFEFHVNFVVFRLETVAKGLSSTASVSPETVHLIGESLVLMH